jgi:hypothetical protein
VYKFNLKNVSFTMENSVSVKVPDMRIIACKSGIADPDAEAKAERAAGEAVVELVAGARRRKRSDDFGEDDDGQGLLFTTIRGLCVIDCFAIISWTFPHFWFRCSQRRR